MPAAVRVDVVPALFEARVARELEHDRRERLVHLDHGDVVPAEPGPRERLAHACGLPCSIRCGSTPASPNETNRARGSSPSRDAAASLAISTAAAPSQIWREFPAVTLPVRQERRLRARQRLRGRVAPRRLVDAEERRPTCGFVTSTGTISLLEPPLVDRGDRAPVRLERERVELLAREAPLLGDAPRRRSPAGRSATARAAVRDGRRRSSPSGRATSSRRRPRRRRRAAPTRPRPPR